MVQQARACLSFFVASWQTSVYADITGMSGHVQEFVCFSSISTAVIDELPYCVLEVGVRGHTLRVLTVPVGFSVGLLPILLVWTLLVAEALYDTRLQAARVSFKPA